MLNNYRIKMAQKNKQLGDCYEANGRFIVNAYIRDKTTDIKICHGIVTGQKGTPVEGEEFGHCWLEINEMVLDYSNGKKLCIPKRDYYLLGKIKNVIYYTPKEYSNLIVKHSHWGPYENGN